MVPPEFDGANVIDLLIVRKPPEIDSAYLSLYLNSSVTRTQVRFMSVGAIQAHYNTTTLANLLIAFPSPDEQHRILVRVRQEASILDAAIARAEREIQLIKEYRTRLVSDVVTGKLDVRDATVELPEDVGDEPMADLAEAFDEAEVDDLTEVRV